MFKDVRHYVYGRICTHDWFQFLMDKAIVKVNQNEFNRYENLINTAYVVSQSILPFTDYTYKWSSFGQ
jgi:hypothetical protein